MSTWALDYELRAVSSGDPAVRMPVTVLGDEVDPRQRHVDEAAGELRRPLAEAVESDGEIPVALPARSPRAFAAVAEIHPG